ncbi:MAG: Lrp/AsnC family transcriptional regulator [Candidatus Aenigmarchaeota archaeon]|nr:Lrp/AsnC family transcriptional regulator [Candidatus Aenigmarchaeota archaeon]
MDNKDRKILDLLREDCRSTSKEIAEKLSMRPTTVHQRIVKLKRDGVIEKFTVKLNDKKMGEEFTAFMFIKTNPSSEISYRVFGDTHVKEVFGLTGEYDMMMKMKFSDVKEFNDFILDFRRRENVVSTVTMVATAKIKEDI